MSVAVDETHDPALESWVESANDPASDFPIQNLPFGRFRRTPKEPWRIGVAIGDHVIDLRGAGLIGTDDTSEVMATVRRREIRGTLSQGLRHGGGSASRLREALVPQSRVELGLPCTIGDYTDFYVGIHHATAVGRLFRPDNPLLPQLQVGTDRLSRPGVVDSRERP